MMIKLSTKNASFPTLGVFLETNLFVRRNDILYMRKNNLPKLENIAPSRTNVLRWLHLPYVPTFSDIFKRPLNP